MTHHSLQKKSGPTADANTIHAIDPQSRFAPGGQGRGGNSSRQIPFTAITTASATATINSINVAKLNLLTVDSSFCNAYGVASCPNHQRRASARPLVSKNRRSRKTTLEQLFVPFGPINRRLISRSASAAVSARRNSISMASASLRRFVSPPSSRNCSTEFQVSYATTKDGAEPSIASSSDAGAVPAASTMGASVPVVGHWPVAGFERCGASLMGAKQDRRRSDDRSCARHDTAVIGSKPTCERQQVRCRNAPRGVVEAARAGAWQQNSPVINSLCSPDCRHSVECWFYGCPFKTGVGK